MCIRDSSEPTYIVDGVVHYCVANMPGAVGRTSTFALCNVTLPWVLCLAKDGVGYADHSREIATAINVHDQKVTNAAVADAFEMEFSDLWGVAG